MSKHRQRKRGLVGIGIHILNRTKSTARKIGTQHKVTWVSNTLSEKVKSGLTSLQTIGEIGPLGVHLTRQGRFGTTEAREGNPGGGDHLAKGGLIKEGTFNENKFIVRSKT